MMIEKNGDRPVNGMPCNEASRELDFRAKDIKTLIRCGLLFGMRLNDRWYLSQGAFDRLVENQEYFEKILGGIKK